MVLDTSSEMTTVNGDTDLLARAEAAFAIVEADAAAAARLAQRILDAARRDGDAEAQVVALHTLSYARHELGDPDAIRYVRAAIRIGERHGLARRTAMARRRLALDLAGRGSFARALRELDRAATALDPHEQARTEVFRLAIHYYAGSEGDVLTGAEAAASTLRRAGDSFWEAQLLRNRGVLLAERGAVDAAEPDLERARDLFAAVGASAGALSIELQLARIQLARGDIPACLARLDVIDDALLPAIDHAERDLLRAQALAAGRLFSEALDALAAAQTSWRRAARDDHEGRIEMIRLTLLAGDPAAARAAAVQAQRSFAAQRRPVYAARAAGLALAAAIASGELHRGALGSGRRAAERLAGAGRRAESQRVRLAVARAAVQLGSIAAAQRELARCASLFRAGPVADRVEARHVQALIAMAQGDRDAAVRAARAGLRLLERHRATLGAWDLRVSASSMGAGLAQLGLRTALADGRSARVFEWAEALRASALRLTPVVPPSSDELRALNTELRQLGAQVTRAEHSGRSTAALLSRQADVETRVRRLSRHSAAGEVARARLDQPLLGSRLGQRALIEYIATDGELTAVTLVKGRFAVHPLGPSQAVAEQLEWLRFGLTRLAHLGRGARQRDALLSGTEASASALQAQLIAPLIEALGERELVIVPTGELHDLPWSMLPALQGRAIAVAPSATAWSTLRTPRATKPAVLLAAGPRLRYASAEVAALSGLYADATRLTGRAATAADVLAALDGATVAHLACHGRFRADSPLFSALELADGPLNAYNLQRLRLVPELIVLSACDLAVSDAHPGDELLGFAAALLDMGTRCVIASIVPVPDAPAKRLMLRLHQELVAGAAPAAALARAQASLPRRDLALRGFVCLGAG